MENLIAGSRSSGPSMSSMSEERNTHIYRISKRPHVGGILDSVESLETFARGHGPGRYDVDDHSLDPFPGTRVSASAGAR
jgi:hypothetical protein